MSQGAKDVGLPDRSGCSGWLTPGRVVEFWGWKTLLAPIRKPRYSTPLTSVMSSTTTMAVPMKNATSWCSRQRLISSRASSFTASASTRQVAIPAAATNTAMSSVRR